MSSYLVNHVSRSVESENDGQEGNVNGLREGGGGGCMRGKGVATPIGIGSGVGVSPGRVYLSPPLSVPSPTPIATAPMNPSYRYQTRHHPSRRFNGTVADRQFMDPYQSVSSCTNLNRDQLLEEAISSGAQLVPRKSPLQREVTTLYDADGNQYVIARVAAAPKPNGNATPTPSPAHHSAKRHERLQDHVHDENGGAGEEAEVGGLDYRDRKPWIDRVSPAASTQTYSSAGRIRRNRTTAGRASNARDNAHSQRLQNEGENVSMERRTYRYIADRIDEELHKALATTKHSANRSNYFHNRMFPATSLHTRNSEVGAALNHVVNSESAFPEHTRGGGSSGGDPQRRPNRPPYAPLTHSSAAVVVQQVYEPPMLQPAPPLSPYERTTRVKKHSRFHPKVNPTHEPVGGSVYESYSQMMTMTNHHHREDVELLRQESVSGTSQREILASLSTGAAALMSACALLTHLPLNHPLRQKKLASILKMKQQCDELWKQCVGYLPGSSAAPSWDSDTTCTDSPLGSYQKTLRRRNRRGPPHQSEPATTSLPPVTVEEHTTSNESVHLLNSTLTQKSLLEEDHADLESGELDAHTRNSRVRKHSSTRGRSRTPTHSARTHSRSPHADKEAESEQCGKRVSSADHSSAAAITSPEGTKSALSREENGVGAVSASVLDAGATEEKDTFVASSDSSSSSHSEVSSNTSSSSSSSSSNSSSSPSASDPQLSSIHPEVLSSDGRATDVILATEIVAKDTSPKANKEKPSGAATHTQRTDGKASRNWNDRGATHADGSHHSRVVSHVRGKRKIAKATSSSLSDSSPPPPPNVNNTQVGQDTSLLVPFLRPNTAAIVEEHLRELGGRQSHRRGGQLPRATDSRSAVYGESSASGHEHRSGGTVDEDESLDDLPPHVYANAMSKMQSSVGVPTTSHPIYSETERSHDTSRTARPYSELRMPMQPHPPSPSTSSITSTTTTTTNTGNSSSAHWESVLNSRNGSRLQRSINTGTHHREPERRGDHSLDAIIAAARQRLMAVIRRQVAQPRGPSSDHSAGQ